MGWCQGQSRHLQQDFLPRCRGGDSSRWAHAARASASRTRPSRRCTRLLPLRRQTCLHTCLHLELELDNVRRVHLRRALDSVYDRLVVAFAAADLQPRRAPVDSVRPCHGKAASRSSRRAIERKPYMGFPTVRMSLHGRGTRIL